MPGLVGRRHRHMERALGAYLGKDARVTGAVARLNASLAAVQSAAGEVVGSGFLVTERHILTCAHVVNAALGAREDEARRPEERITVEFPLSAAGRRLGALVERWIPIDAEGSGDVALLALVDEAPESARPAPLAAPADTWNHAFRSFGFPRGYPSGLWSTGRIRGPQRNGWIQLEDVKIPGAAVERGFSGGAVYDEELQAVVGMVVAQDLHADRKIAFMLPAVLLARLLPELAGVAELPTGPVGALSNVPVPPPHYLARAKEVAEVRQAVLDGAGEAADGGRKIAIVGMGGAGKSVLAAAVGRDPQVRRSFPDGVIWVELGPEASLPERQAQLASALGMPEAAFVDVQYGRAELSRLLTGRRCLVILDNVWKAEHITAFDVLGSHSRLLFTTRDAGLSRASGARGTGIGLLDDEQAAALLADWAGHSAADLPAEAVQIARECGNLPLALAMAGAMVGGRPERWAGVLRRLRQADLEKIRQAFPHYPHHNLLLAIEVSVEALEPGERERYLDLAVFQGRAVPAHVVELLWEPLGVDDLETEELLDLFAERSLARMDGDRDLTLHDLQMDYVCRRAGDVARLHTRLLDAYARRAPHGWASGPADGYYFENLAHHLVRAGRKDQLRMLLLNMEWLSAKLSATDMTSLLADFAGIEDADVVLLRDALRLSSHVLARNPDQLAAQLVGRLAGSGEPAIRRLVAQARAWSGRPWLCPQGPSLITPDTPMLRSLVGHTGWVRTIAPSGDGLMAVSGADDRTIRVWRLDDGVERHTLRGHDGSVWSVALTPDGRWAVSGSVDGTVRVWDLREGVQRHVLRGHQGSVWSVAVTPDGRRAVSGSADGTVRVWDLREGVQRHVLRGHQGAVMSLRLSRDGRMAASGSEDGTVRTWLIEDGTPLLGLDSGERWVQSATVALTGRHVLFGSDSGTLHVWHLHDGSPAFSLASGHGAIWALATTPDGKRAAVSSMEGPLTVWDLDTGARQATLHGHSGWVGALAATADSRHVVSGGDDAIVRVWDIASGREVAALRGHAGWINAVATAADGRHIISGSADGALRVWDLENLATRSGQPSHTGWVTAMAAVPRGDDGLVVSGSDDTTLRVWRTGTGGEHLVLRDHAGAVVGLAVLDGGRVVSASGDGTLRVWELDGGRNERTWSTGGRAVTAMTVVPGRYAVAGTGDGSAHIWDLRTGDLHRVLETGEAVQVVRVTPDGKRLVTGGAEGTVAVWDLETGQALHLCRGPGGPVLSLTVSPDGSAALAGCIDGVLIAWDLHSGEARWEVRAHETLLNALVLLGPDGRRAVSGGGDGAIRIWDVVTGQRAGALPSAEGAVRALASTADGRLVVSGAGNTVALWDLAAGTEVARFLGDSGITACLVEESVDPLIICGEASGGVHVLRLRTPGA
ncbi:NB-ARC domain-containing protein [Streptosporangium sp. NPDC000396]|uniref:NB-ARC domain-containing protein n=1 Tax=Streptosporangium sp. NPDC000396 TaxID=3366185 RepID=UPI00367CB0B7